MSVKNVSLEELESISPALLQVGISLPYDLYNSKGKFISAKDYIFKNEMEVSMVAHAKPMKLRTDAISINKKDNDSINTSEQQTTSISHNNYIEYGTGEKLKRSSREYGFKKSNLTDESANTGSEVGVVNCIGQLVDKFPILYDAFYEDTVSAPKLLNEMVDQTLVIINKDIDAAIGVIHISEIHSQAEHCIFAAILASIYARTIGYPNRFVKLVASSAICMNLGAIKLHHELNSKDTELNDGLLAEVRKHSEASVDLMAKTGIRHPTINNAILYHHERPDGEGYPKGLHSQEIPDEALIIGIVDTYLAMIGPRAYRQKVQPKEALKQVLFEGHKYDNDFYTTFIKAIGVYPAGTFHELTDGEVVVVARRDPEHATKPQVCTIVTENEKPVSDFKVRKLSESKQSIKAPHPGGRELHLNPGDIWK